MPIGQDSAGAFAYVRIPAALELPIEQETFPHEVTHHSDFRFIRHLRVSLGCQAVDAGGSCRGQLLEDLFGSEAAQGADVKEFAMEKESLRKGLELIEDQQLELLLSLSELGFVHLTQPDLALGTTGKTIVHGGLAAANLPLNERAMELCSACGFPPKPLHGPCFVTCTEAYLESGDNNPGWRRCDLLLRDCSTDAPWVQELRYHREKSGFREADEREWLASLPDSASAPPPSGANDTYTWHQADGDVEINFSRSPFSGIRAVKRDVTVRITSKHVFVRLRGRVLLNAELFSEIDPGQSCWTYIQARHELTVLLVKSDPSALWPDLCVQSVGGGGKETQDELVMAPDKEHVCCAEPSTGQRVMLYGLKDDKLNGECGEVLPCSQGQLPAGRVGVRLESGREVAVRREHLSMAPPALNHQSAVFTDISTPVKDPAAFADTKRCLNQDAAPLPTQTRAEPLRDRRRRLLAWVVGAGAFYYALLCIAWLSTRRLGTLGPVGPAFPSR